MESLLFDIKLGRSSYGDLARIHTEQQYYRLTQLSAPEHHYRRHFPAKCHASGINTMDIDPQTHTLLLSGGSDSSIKLWSLDDADDADGEIRTVASVPRKTGHQFGVSSIKWWTADNGLFLSSSFDQTVKIWDASTLEDVYSFAADSKIYDIDVSGTGAHALVATANESSLIRLVDMKSTATSQTLRGHKGKVLAVKWSPTDPYLLASGGVDGELKLWDIRRANSCVCSLDQFQVEEQDSNITVSPAKKRRLAEDIAHVKYQFDDRSPKSHAGTINSILFSDLGDTVVSSGTDEKIKVWDLKAPGGRNMLVNFGPVVKNRYPQRLTPCLSPASETELQYLWFPNDNGELLVFNVADGQMVARLNKATDRRGAAYAGPAAAAKGYVLNNQRVTSVVYGGGARAVYYSGSLDGKIRIWGPDSQVQLPAFSARDVEGGDGDDNSHNAASEDNSPNVLDQIHDEMQARKLMQRNPFI